MLPRYTRMKTTKIYTLFFVLLIFCLSITIGLFAVCSNINESGHGEEALVYIFAYIFVLTFLGTVKNLLKKKWFDVLYNVCFLPGLLIMMIGRIVKPILWVVLAILFYFALSGGLIGLGLIVLRNEYNLLISGPLILYIVLFLNGVSTCFFHSYIVKVILRFSFFDNTTIISNDKRHIDAYVKTTLSAENIKLLMYSLYVLFLIFWSYVQLECLDLGEKALYLDATLQAFLTYLGLNELVGLWVRCKGTIHKTIVTFVFTVLTIIGVYEDDRNTVDEVNE